MIWDPLLRCSFYSKAARAVAAGAVAVIFVNSDGELFTVAPVRAAYS